MSGVFIQMLGEFSITVRGVRHDNLVAKSRKGISLLTYLVMQNGKPVSNQRLIREMWSSRNSASPESALKTMVSRLRGMLNDLSDGLGACIQSNQGAYCWQSLPGVQVDALEFMALLEELKGQLTREQRLEKYGRVQALYQGDLAQTGELINGVIQSSWLHREYLECMYAYVHLLREMGSYAQVRDVCRQALQVDELDDFLQIELIHAEAALEHGAGTDALARKEERYRHVSALGKGLQDQLEQIGDDLLESDVDQKGPFFCDYPAFREFYHIQARNLERLGSTMLLCVITVEKRDGQLSAVARESAMAGLQEVLRHNLRKGDIITRYAPDVFALLLPTVNYNTGTMVMDRIEKIFNAEYNNPQVALYHRITPLGALPDMAASL